MRTKREILDGVANGAVDPQEAARLLGKLERERGSDASGAVRRVRVVSELGRVTVVGDPAVATVVANGPHEMRTTGDTTEVHCAPSVQRVGFVTLPARGGERRSQSVTIRMNPALALELSVAAGKVGVRGVAGPISADVELGSLVIEGFAGPIDLSAAAGSIVARGCIDSGASQVRCELGKVRLELTAGSDVAITGRAELGSVSLPGGVRVAGLRGLADDADDPAAMATVGAGAGTLDVRTSAGRIQVLHAP